MIPQDEWRVMNSGGPENVTALIVDAKGYRIARAYPSRNGQETALARARLIAIVPEMAQFIAKVLWAYEIAAAEKGEECQCGICRDARALLARIEGKEG